MTITCRVSRRECHSKTGRLLIADQEFTIPLANHPLF